MISFSRSALSVAWDPSFASLLELAEACDVPVKWACRTGVCHTCETGLVSGEVSYRPDPLEPPRAGGAMILLRATGGRGRARSLGCGRPGPKVPGCHGPLTWIGRGYTVAVCAGLSPPPRSPAP